MKTTIAFVTRANGFFGDETLVVSAHRTVKAAKKAAGPGWCVRLGSLAKGDTFRRASEGLYPVVR